MAIFDVQKKQDRMVLHAPSNVIDRFATACSYMQPPVPYSVARSEHGANLIVKPDDFERMLDQHPMLRCQLERELEPEAHAGKNGLGH